MEIVQLNVSIHLRAALEVGKDKGSARPGPMSLQAFQRHH